MGASCLIIWGHLSYKVGQVVLSFYGGELSWDELSLVQVIHNSLIFCSDMINQNLKEEQNFFPISLKTQTVKF